MAEGAVRHDREIAQIRESQRKTEETLRKAIRLGVIEARQQRQRHKELEVLLKAILVRGGNGRWDFMGAIPYTRVQHCSKPGLTFDSGWQEV